MDAVVGRIKLTILATVDSRRSTDDLGQLITLSIHLCVQNEVMCETACRRRLSPSDVIAVTIQSPWIGIKFYEDVPLFLDVHEFP